MTAPAVPDLVARILEAVDEAERAENSRYRFSAPPRATPCPECGAARESRYGAPLPLEWTTFRLDSETTYELRPCRCRLTLEQFKTVVGATPCPDRVVLRRCAADRRTIERHRRPGRVEVRGTQDGMWQLEWCECCGALMPCPDLLDRAEAYGLTVDGEQPHADR